MSDETVIKPQRITIDEITSLLSTIARDEDAGADRFRAIKALQGMESASITLPDPMSSDEVDQRVARVMKGAGPNATQRGYLIAFPDLAKKVFGLNMTAATPDMIRRAQRITSLKILNKEFPAFKINGMPKGFPAGKSLVTKATWCRDQAIKYMMEEAAERRRIAHEAMTAAETELEGATDGSRSGAEDSEAETGGEGLPAAEDDL